MVAKEQTGNHSKRPEKVENVVAVEKTLLATIFAYLLIIIMKASVGFLLPSSILKADAVHDLIDLFSLLSAFLAIRISRKAPNKKFPYGFFKIDYLISLLLSIAFIIAAIFLVIEAIDLLLVESASSQSLIPFVISNISTVVVFIISRVLIAKGKQIDSNSLVVVGRDKFLDSFLGIAVTVVLLFTWLNIPYLEGVLMLVIAALIVTSALVSAKDSVLGLLDVSIKEDEVNTIKELILNDDRIHGVKNIKIRKAGMYYFGEITIFLPPKLDIDEISYIINDTRSRLLENVRKLAQVHVSIDVIKDAVITLVIPISGTKQDLDALLSDHFGRANYFAFITIDTSTRVIVNHFFKENEYKKKEVRTGLAVIKNLFDQKVHVVITKNIGDISFITLQQKLIEIFRPPLADSSKNISARDAIELYLEGALEKMREPTREKS